MVKYIPEKTLDEQTASSSMLIAQYQHVRRFSEQLCEPLVTEDYVIQSMPDVSPIKWHLAHTTWFWESFLLAPTLTTYTLFRSEYPYLFNSYYNALGDRHCRPKRGLLSRPTTDETYAYRHHVDNYVLDLLSRSDEKQLMTLAPIAILGMNHEQQHQELMLTDIKHVFSCNPLEPVYAERRAMQNTEILAQSWVAFPGGLYGIGHDKKDFAFDNEEPWHQQFLRPFQLASRLVTNLEYLEFIEDGGYDNPLLWLSDGWQKVQAENWRAPLYWEKRDGVWWMMTLSGWRKVDLAEPVSHVSYYEADAFARWTGARLPTEAEWEVAAQSLPVQGNFVESDLYHPTPYSGIDNKQPLAQMYGDVWEWTQSAYLPYPGYKWADGALGEYNGKFMCNQFVLRGGSCATSVSHVRHTYRNFFPPDARWQFMGLRLAKDL